MLTLFNQGQTFIKQAWQFAYARCGKKDGNAGRATASNKDRC